MPRPATSPSAYPDRTRVERLAYSPAELAEAIGCTRQHVHVLMTRGDIRFVKLGRLTRIPASEAARLLAGSPRDAA